jgi:hypothetical protein
MTSTVAEHGQHPSLDEPFFGRYSTRMDNHRRVLPSSVIGQLAKLFAQL